MDIGRAPGNSLSEIKKKKFSPDMFQVFQYSNTAEVVKMVCHRCIAIRLRRCSHPATD